MRCVSRTFLQSTVNDPWTIDNGPLTYHHHSHKNTFPKAKPHLHLNHVKAFEHFMEQFPDGIAGIACQ